MRTTTQSHRTRAALLASAVVAVAIAALAAPGVASAANLSEGFDAVVPTGWTAVNNSSPAGTTSWFQGDPVIFGAHQGAASSYAAANYSNTSAGGTIDNWLISPSISTLTNHDRWSFFTRKPGGPSTIDYPDRLELRLSTSGRCRPGSGAGAVGDFTTVLATINPNLVAGGYPRAWTEFKGVLRKLPVRAAGCFAFRYYVTDAGANAPNSDYIGIDTFSFTEGVDRPPVAARDTASVDEDQTLTVAAPGVLGNDTDPNGEALTATLVTGPAHGTVTLRPDGSYTYAPAADYNGPDSFTYTATDEASTSNSATVDISVNPVDDAPAAAGDSASVAEDETLTVAAPGVLRNDTDKEGDPLTAALVTGPAHGTITLNADGSYTYIPAADYNGADSFTYTANAGAAASNTATVDITVNPVGDPPVGTDDVTSLDEDAGATAVDVLANDTDVDGGRIAIVSVTQPANGTVAITGGGTGVSYTPAAGYCNTRPGGAPDAFNYTVNGGSTATVRVTVTCAPAAPPAPQPTPPADAPQAPGEPAVRIGRISISHPRVRLHRGLIEVRLACRGVAGARCAGTLQLEATGLGARPAPPARPGTASFTISAGRTRTLRFRPTSSTLRLLATRGRVVVRATARAGGGPAVRRLITVLPERRGAR
jgi:VCBS repeat-containing protein